MTDRASDATDSIDEVTPATQPGYVLELHGFAVVTFDPDDVQVNTPEDSTVGGSGSMLLTEADCQKLFRALIARNQGKS